jgi:hypothetical protein
MSTRDDYEKKLDTIKAIKTDQIKTPHHIPVNVYIHEAETLFHWAREDKETLTTVGLSGELLEDLPIRAGTLSEAESLWYVQKNTSKESTRKWTEESPRAYDLRDRLLHDFRYAFRKHSDLMENLNHIAKGKKSHGSMIQDLSDLGGLGKRNRQLLDAINFDMSLLDKTAQTTSEMTKLLAEVTAIRTEYNEAKRIRDQAYTHLKEAVDEIRECGQYVFRGNKERLSGYRSDYLRKKKIKKTPKPEIEKESDK